MPKPTALLSAEALRAIATTAAILRREIYAQDPAADASQITAAIMPALVSASMDDLIQAGQPQPGARTRTLRAYRQDDGTEVRHGDTITNGQGRPAIFYRATRPSDDPRGGTVTIRVDALHEHERDVYAANYDLRVAWSGEPEYGKGETETGAGEWYGDAAAPD